MNIGNFCRAQILLGKTNTEILNLVQNQFPTAKTTPACIAWYKSDMRKKGMLEKKTPAKLMTKEELLAALAQMEAAVEATEPETDQLELDLEGTEETQG